MKTAMPLPFFADDRAVKHWDHGHAYTVARIDPSNKFTPESRPDFAAYLANAANSHPELLEACKALLRRIEWHQENLTSFPLDVAAADRARAAIARATITPA